MFMYIIYNNKYIMLVSNIVILTIFTIIYHAEYVHNVVGLLPTVPQQCENDIFEDFRVAKNAWNYRRLLTDTALKKKTLETCQQGHSRGYFEYLKSQLFVADHLYHPRLYCYKNYESQNYDEEQRYFGLCYKKMKDNFLESDDALLVALDIYTKKVEEDFINLANGDYAKEYYNLVILNTSFKKGFWAPMKYCRKLINQVNNLDNEDHKCNKHRKNPKNKRGYEDDSDEGMRNSPKTPRFAKTLGSSSGTAGFT